MGISSFFEKRSWKKSVELVNGAAKILQVHGLGYSPTHGVVGDLSILSKKEFKNINKATAIMKQYSAGYFTKPVTKNADDFKAARYAPISFANYGIIQAKVLRQLYSSSHLRSGVQAITRTLYDTRIQSEIDRFSLGISADASQEWVNRVERLWRIEKELKSWDYYGENNYAQVADMAKQSYIGLGEFFAIIRLHGSEDTIQNNVSIQLISPFQVQTPVGGIFPAGNRIEQGIELNKYGHKVAIWVAPAEIGETAKRIPFQNAQGFKQVIHGFIQKEPGQIRGIPDSAKSWHEYMAIEDMLKFEMDSAKINSTISGSVSASDANATESIRANIKEIGLSVAQGGAGFGGGMNQAVPEVNQPVTYDVREVPAGGFIIQNLPPGYVYKEHDTKRPNVNIPNFIEKDLDYIFTANFGISVGVVNQVLEGSYNASKAKIDLSWKRSIEYYLKQFESDFDREIYRTWLSAKIGQGKIFVTDWANNREAWLGMRVITPTKPSLNPFVDAKTAEMRINNGTSNREYESQTYNGRSYSDNIERIKNENVSFAEAKQLLEIEDESI